MTVTQVSLEQSIEIVALDGWTTPTNSWKPSSIGTHVLPEKILLIYSSSFFIMNLTNPVGFLSATSS
jgi:hypothetical protein